jgi:hypothetical protein
MREKSDKAGRPIVPMYGEEIAEQVRKALQQPPEIVARLTTIINTKEP